MLLAINLALVSYTLTLTSSSTSLCAPRAGIAVCAISRSELRARQKAERDLGQALLKLGVRGNTATLYSEKLAELGTQLFTAGRKHARSNNAQLSLLLWSVLVEDGLLFGRRFGRDDRGLRCCD